MREVIIASSVRTPVGRAYKGTLRATRPDELAAVAIKGALERLPQLDATMYPEQLFWLAVSFVTLYILMTFIALPGVRNTQEKRHAMLAADLAAAAAATAMAPEVHPHDAPVSSTFRALAWSARPARRPLIDRSSLHRAPAWPGLR